MKASRIYTVLFQVMEDGTYVASAVNIPGCHTQGKTRDEARKRIKEAICLMLDESNSFFEEVEIPIEEEFPHAPKG